MEAGIVVRDESQHGVAPRFGKQAQATWPMPGAAAEPTRVFVEGFLIGSIAFPQGSFWTGATL